MKIYRIFLPFIFLFILSVGCKSEPKEKEIDYYASPLFIDVQMQALFEDSKTLPDATQGLVRFLRLIVPLPKIRT